jgi:hypothetical protein
MKRTYTGVMADENGGLTPMGKIIMDAWVFGFLPEEEDASGWDLGRLQVLYDQVYAAWDPYGHLPSRLPEEQQQRHQRIYDAARARAKTAGWDPERDCDD